MPRHTTPATSANDHAALWELCEHDAYVSERYWSRGAPPLSGVSHAGHAGWCIPTHSANAEAAFARGEWPARFGGPRSHVSAHRERLMSAHVRRQSQIGDLPRDEQPRVLVEPVMDPSVEPGFGRFLGHPRQSRSLVGEESTEHVGHGSRVARVV